MSAVAEADYSEGSAAERRLEEGGLIVKRPGSNVPIHEYRRTCVAGT